MITHALGYTLRALGSRINRRTSRSLFPRRSPGIWYDPQDLTTMYQDAAGTLPVYRPGTGLVDPPVGLMLDKSGGEYHASQSTTTARPTLSGRYNLLLATETLSTQSVTAAATDYTLRFEGTGTVTLSGAATGTYTAGTRTITCTARTLILTVAGTVTKADLRVKRDGSSMPAYQEVANANTYDTDGFPLYLKRDRVDDDLIVQAPAINGVSAWGAAEGSLFGKVNIAAGEYHPLGVITGGLTTCTQLIHIDGALSVAETTVLEKLVANKSGTTYGVTTADPVDFQFDLTSVSTFNFTMKTQSGLPVLVDWGDGNTSTYAGAANQTATKTYAASGNYTVKVYAKDYSVLTKFDTFAAGMSGTLSLPSGMTEFRCGGSNTLSGYTPSAKSPNQIRFSLAGQNTLSATDVDNILIDYDAAGGTWTGSKEITIQGNAADRTSASDAAYASLATKLTILNVD